MRKGTCSQCGNERELWQCGTCARELCPQCLTGAAHLREHEDAGDRFTSTVADSALLMAALEDAERVCRVLRTLVRRRGAK